MSQTIKNINPWIKENPTTVFLYPTMLCNLKCKMCYSGAYQEKNDAHGEEMDLETYKRLIHELYGIGVRRYDISGGEPFLRKDIDEIFRYIKSYPDNSLYVVCNGTVLEQIRSRLEVCLPLIDRIHISIDSTIPEQHDEIRGKKGAFQRAMKGLAILRDKNFKYIGINTVIMNENRNQVQAILEMALQQGVRYVNLLRLLDVAEQGLLAKENPGPEVLTDICKIILEWMEDKEKEGFDELFEIELVLPGYCMESVGQYRRQANKFKNMKLHIRFDPVRGCPAFGNSVVITSEGKVTGCTAFIKDEEMYVGDVREQPLDGIRYHFKEMREMLKERELFLKTVEPCSTCSYWNACRGGCPAAAYRYHRSINYPDPTCIVALTNKKVWG